MSSLLLETYSNWHKVIGHIFQTQRCPKCLVMFRMSTKPLQKSIRGRDRNRKFFWEEIQKQQHRGQGKILSISLKAPSLGQQPPMAAAGKRLGELTSWHQSLVLNTAKWLVKETGWDTTLAVAGTAGSGEIHGRTARLGRPLNSSINHWPACSELGKLIHLLPKHCLSQHIRHCLCQLLIGSLLICCTVVTSPATSAGHCRRWCLLSAGFASITSVLLSI